MRIEKKIEFFDPEGNCLMVCESGPEKVKALLLEKFWSGGLTKEFEFGNEKAFPKKIIG